MKRVKMLFVVLMMSLMFTPTLYAATYDANGAWTITTAETVLTADFGFFSQSIEVDSFNSEVNITQGDDNSFNFSVDIAELGGAVEGGGIVVEALYDFRPTLLYSGVYDSYDITVAANSFSLLSAFDLEGYFDIYLGALDGNNTLSDLMNVGRIDYSGSAAPVPVPGAVWLLGSGIIGLVGMRRKARNS